MTEPVETPLTPFSPDDLIEALSDAEGRLSALERKLADCVLADVA